MIATVHCMLELAVNTDEALKWVATMFESPLGSLTEETTREEIPGWDSLGALMMMADLDEKFRIQVDENQVRAMAKVGDILALLRKHGAMVS